MLLSEFMRREGLTDSDVANAVGLSTFTVRKLRFRDRGTSIGVAARIEALSRGAVRAVDLQPLRSLRPPLSVRETAP